MGTGREPATGQGSRPALLFRVADSFVRQTRAVLQVQGGPGSRPGLRWWGGAEEGVTRASGSWRVIFRPAAPRSGPGSTSAQAQGTQARDRPRSRWRGSGGTWEVRREVGGVAVEVFLRL